MGFLNEVNDTPIVAAPSSEEKLKNKNHVFEN